MIKRNLARGFTILLGFAGLTAILLSGCRSAPASEHVVIPPEQVKLMNCMKEQGLQRAWGKPERIRQYDKIDIAVKISPKQIDKSWWARQNVRRLVASKDEDMKYAAEYARDSFLKAFENSKSFKIVAKPGPKTLSLEFAIVQMIPNKPIMGAVSNLSNLSPIGLMMSPLKLAAKSSSQDQGGAIAMETIVRDSVSGEILGVVAERQKGKTAYFNASEFTAYANVRRIIDTWTRNIVVALDQIKAGEKVQVQQDWSWGVIDF